MEEGTLVGQIAIIATTILGFSFTWLLANRRRRWDLEDMTRKADALARQVTVTAAEVKDAQLHAALTLAQQVTRTAAEVKATQLQAADTLAAKVEASAVDVRHDFTSATTRIVEAADRAYLTANGLNAKIATVTATTNDQFNSLLNSVTTDRKLAKIDETTVEIDTKVSDIHRGLELEEKGRKDRIKNE